MLRRTYFLLFPDKINDLSFFKFKISHVIGKFKQTVYITETYNEIITHSGVCSQSFEYGFLKN